jgi:hypothetical protein
VKLLKMVLMLGAYAAPSRLLVELVPLFPGLSCITLIDLKLVYVILRDTVTVIHLCLLYACNLILACI